MRSVHTTRVDLFQVDHGVTAPGCEKRNTGVPRRPDGCVFIKIISAQKVYGSIIQLVWRTISHIKADIESAI